MCLEHPHSLFVICIKFHSNNNRNVDKVCFRLKHGIGADQDLFMLYHWYRKNIHDMNKFHKLSRLTVTYLNLLKISRC